MNFGKGVEEEEKVEIRYNSEGMVEGVSFSGLEGLAWSGSGLYDNDGTRGKRVLTKLDEIPE